MSFSPDGKSLLTQGGAPDWTLVNWQWEKGRPLQYAKVSNKAGAQIYQVCLEFYSALTLIVLFIAAVSVLFLSH
jgi:hypothetical protein